MDGWMDVWMRERMALLIVTPHHSPRLITDKEPFCPCELFFIFQYLFA